MPTARQACRSSQPRLLHGGLEDRFTCFARLVEDRLRECSPVVKIRHQGFATAPKATLGSRARMDASPRLDAGVRGKGRDCGHTQGSFGRLRDAQCSTWNILRTTNVHAPVETYSARGSRAGKSRLCLIECSWTTLGSTRRRDPGSHLCPQKAGILRLRLGQAVSKTAGRGAPSWWSK